MFELLAQDQSGGSRTRRGRLTTAHGMIETPAFMPVGTQASVKAVSPRELRELSAQIILANTYHLFVRPGIDLVRHFGGLHKFMNWNGPILTDSGGYQIFSLAKLRKITEEGVQFQNHIDGTAAFISPEIAMEIQAALGSDIAMVLDECPPWPCEYDYAARSAEMTTRWARRCKEWKEENAQLRKLSRAGSSTFNSESLCEQAVQRSTTEAVEAGMLAARSRSAAGTAATTEASGSISYQPLVAPKQCEGGSTTNQLLFGIIQGGTFDDVRKASAQAIVDLEFDGYAIGGVSVGEPEEEMVQAVEASEPFLPNDKPRYAMGLGTPPQLLEMIARGMDLFDCVLPTRLARNGTAFTSRGTLNLRNAEFAMDKRPIEENCACPGCREFARGYIRHLIKAEEILGLRLVTLHNLHFYLDLMRQARDAIEDARFDSFRKQFLGNYKTRNGPVEKSTSTAAD
jgi:queuine tRNA-ribosyltransferase